jgi:uncharacterized protein
MGVALGMLGSGGSILLVPAMVYFLAIDPVTAADYSMFVVGITTLYAVIRSWAEIRTYASVIWAFGLPSVIGIAVMRRYIMPLIPDIIWQSEGLIVSKKSLIMVIFAIAMTIVARNMIRPLKSISTDLDQTKPMLAMLSILGFAIGMLSGFLGIGGGFIIVPILVVIYRYPMQQAVTISLFLIAANALIGFASTMPFYKLDLGRLSLMTTCCVLGMALGIHYRQAVDAQKLKVSFGWFIAVVGILVLGKELF